MPNVLFHKKPRQLYPKHEDAVRAAMELNRDEDEWTFVATHNPEGSASWIEVREYPTGDLIGYW